MRGRAGMVEDVRHLIGRTRSFEPSQDPKDLYKKRWVATRAIIKTSDRKD